MSILMHFLAAIFMVTSAFSFAFFGYALNANPHGSGDLNAAFSIGTAFGVSAFILQVIA